MARPEHALRGLVLIAALALGAAGGARAEDWLQRAAAALAAGDQATARRLYETAAAAGDARAHFALAYRFVLPAAEGARHYAEAARLGYAEALPYALDALFFRAGDLRLGDPAAAKALIGQARRRDPAAVSPSDATDIERCVEAGPFDGARFVAENALAGTLDSAREPYASWRIAEDAANGRFGPPDARLVLNLVCRGGEVPAEVSDAVAAAYAIWKQGGRARFDMCRHVTSGMGAGVCAARAETAAATGRRQVIERIAGPLGPEAAAAVRKAFAAAERFIEAKARQEEGHGGSGRSAWVQASVTEQMDAFAGLLERRLDGFTPDAAPSLAAADRDLNATYRTTLAGLDRLPASGRASLGLTKDGLRAVQRLWIPFRDATADAVARIGPPTPRETWLAWLTAERTAQLTTVREMIAR